MFNEKMFKDKHIVVRCLNEQQAINLLGYLYDSVDFYDLNMFNEEDSANDSIRCHDRVYKGYDSSDWYQRRGFHVYDYEDVIIKNTKSKQKTKMPNIDFRRKILNEIFKNGKIGTINFIKKDGTERTMNCRIKRVQDEERKQPNRKVNNEVMTFWEISKQGYRSVRLDSIVSVSGSGETIKF